MNLQTILISNRKLKRKRNKCNELFGEELNSSNNDPTDINLTMAIGTANEMFQKVRRRRRRGNGFRTLYKTNKTPYCFNLVPEGEEPIALQQQLDNYDNGKPWLFFVHGNNQTFAKNIMKMRTIQHQYDANIIAFSWPSRSFDDKLLLNFAKAIIYTAITRNYLGGFKKLGTSLERKVQQYKEARTKATQSVDSFGQAFQLLQQHFLNPLKATHPNSHTSMLVHSLGHKIIREAIVADTGLSDFEFNQILLHQADESVIDHPVWVKQCQVAQDENITITRNGKDAVLFLSDMLHNVVPDNGKVTLKVFREVVARAADLFLGDGIDENLSTRIGNRKDIDAHYGNIQSLDFNGQGLTHDVAWNDSTDDEIIEKVKNILIGLP